MRIQYYVVKDKKVKAGPYSRYQEAAKETGKGKVYATDVRGKKNVELELQNYQLAPDLGF